jgi:hypothetical protein
MIASLRKKVGPFVPAALGPNPAGPPFEAEELRDDAVSLLV